MEASNTLQQNLFQDKNGDMVFLKLKLKHQEEQVFNSRGTLFYALQTSTS